MTIIQTKDPVLRIFDNTHPVEIQKLRNNNTYPVMPKTPNAKEGGRPSRKSTLSSWVPSGLYISLVHPPKGILCPSDTE